MARLPGTGAMPSFGSWHNHARRCWQPHPAPAAEEAAAAGGTGDGVAQVRAAATTQKVLWCLFGLPWRIVPCFVIFCR